MVFFLLAPCSCILVGPFAGRGPGEADAFCGRVPLLSNLYRSLWRHVLLKNTLFSGVVVRPVPPFPSTFYSHLLILTSLSRGRLKKSSFSPHRPTPVYFCFTTAAPRTFSCTPPPQIQMAPPQTQPPAPPQPPPATTPHGPHRK